MAAMTIPTLISNYQKKQTVTKLQKANSILSNMTMMLYSEGVYNSLSGVVSADKTEAFYNNYVLKYFKSPQISPDGECAYEPSDHDDCDIYLYPSGHSTRPFDTDIMTDFSRARVFFTTADGISYWFCNMHWVSNDDDSGEFHAEYTSDLDIIVDLNGTAGPNTFGEDCSGSGSGYCCSEKIRRDGWKIKEDYPW